MLLVGVVGWGSCVRGIVCVVVCVVFAFACVLLSVLCCRWFLRLRAWCCLCCAVRGFCVCVRAVVCVVLSVVSAFACVLLFVFGGP